MAKYNKGPVSLRPAEKRLPGISSLPRSNMYYGVTRYGEKAARCHSAAPAELFQHSLYIRRRRHTEAGLNHLIRRWAGLWLFRSVLRRLQLSEKRRRFNPTTESTCQSAIKLVLFHNSQLSTLTAAREFAYIKWGDGRVFCRVKTVCKYLHRCLVQSCFMGYATGVANFFPTDGSVEGLSLIFYICFHSCSFL